MERDARGGWWLGAVFVAAGWLYSSVFSFWAYRDELRHLAHMHRLSEAAHFLGIPPWIRPLEVLVNFANTRLIGYEATHVAHSFSFSVFMVCILLVYLLGRKMTTQCATPALLAATMFALHPVNVASIYRIDTISQSLVTLFSLGYLYWLVGRPSLGLRALPLAFLFTLLLLLSKETSLGLVIGVPLAAFVIRQGQQDSRSLVWREEVFGVVRLLLLAGVVLAAYAILRHEYLMGVMGPEGSRYEVDLSVSNIALNAVMAITSLGYLGNSIELFVEKNAWAAGITLALSVAAVAVVIVGGVAVWRRREWGLLAWCAALVGLILAAIFPAILIKKVNELYSYGPSPYFCLLVSVLGWKGYQQLRGRSPVTGFLAPLLASALIGWMALAVSEKLSYAERENQRARSIYEELTHAMAASTGDGEVCIHGFSPPNTRSYNMFLSPDRDLVQSVVLYVSARDSTPLSLSDRSDDACRYRISVR